MKIVETDNFGGDYPDEKFVNLGWLHQAQAEAICNVINEQLCNYPSAPRIWKVVRDDYVLQPGFEP